MTINNEPKKGVLEGVSRILRELLRTPRFTRSLRILLNEMDPENAPLLVRTLREEDPELFLSLAAASPVFFNALVETAVELCRQGATFQPALMGAFYDDLAGQVNSERLGELVGLLIVLAARISENSPPAMKKNPEGDDFFRGLKNALLSAGENSEIASLNVGELLSALLIKGLARVGENAANDKSATREMVSSMADGLRNMGREHPEFINEVLCPLIDAGRDAMATAQKKEPGHE